MSATDDARLVILAIIITIIDSYTVLNIARRVIAAQRRARKLWLIGGAITIGTSIWSMHFIAMLAYNLPISTNYNREIVFLSLVVAVFASGLALHTVSQKQVSKHHFLVGGSFIGTAIAGMHYTAITAICVQSTEQVIGQNHNIERSALAIVIGITTLVILALTVYAAFVNRRLRTEAALAESQRRLATLIDSLPGIVFSCGNDPYWSMTYLSEGCLELTGYTSEELVGTEGGYNAITHSEDLPKVIKTIDAAIALHQPYVVEYRILTKSGQQKWLWEKGNWVFDSKGEVLGIEGFITDITALKRSEAAITEGEQNYRELFKNHPLPMWIYDCETLHFLAVNNAAIQHYGYSQEEFLSMTIKDIRPSEDVPVLQEKLSQAKSGLELASTWRHCKKDGTVINVEITIHRLTIAGRQAEVVAVNDITQRLQTEAALRQAEAKYRSIFENAVEGIFQTTADGKYLSANPALARIYGYESPKSLIAGLRDIEQQLYVEPLRRAEFISLIEQHGAVSEFEVQVYCQDGSIIWISENARAVKDASGTLLFYEGTVEDITERKQIEQVQARFTAILEATTDFVGIADIHGNSLYLNQAGRKMLGIGSNEDISYRKRSDSHPTWANEIIQNQAIPAVLAGEVWTGETALKNRDSQEIPVSQVILAHKTPAGEVEFIATVMRDISDRKRMEAQLAYLANHDPLTGLFNRRHFQEQLERHLALSQRYNHCGALLFIDLDEFKEINDTLGHQAGDELLQSLAKLLQEQLRETDILGRLGGDEFAILLPETPASGVHLLTQRLLEALQRHVVVTNGQLVRISASIGVTLFPDHGTTAKELLARADLAMYKSKENGRNCLSVYTPNADWQDQVEFKNIWKNRICEALEQDLFVLYYQPISDLRSNQTSRYELLLRMVGKAGELIAPNAFLPIAESSGLICQIDRWVVHQAIHLIAASKKMGRDLELEVNLSGKSLADDELLLTIRRELASTGINPASLILEITETAAIADISRAHKFINTLKQIGCKFALDDFGIGYSSFSQLKYLPVDYLKIDGSFIKNLSEDLANRHLVKAIVEFSHGLAKSTIAEFVGDEGTVQVLRHLGVDCAQGYYIGQPKPATELLLSYPSEPLPVELSGLAVELLN